MRAQQNSQNYREIFKFIGISIALWKFYWTLVDNSFEVPQVLRAFL